MIDFEKCCGKAVVGGAKGVIIGSAAGTAAWQHPRSGRLQPSVLPSAVLSELYSDFSLISPFKFVG